MFKLPKLLKKSNKPKESDKFLEENKDNWIENDYEEGQLSIDVYETDKLIVIKSTIAGVNPDDINIMIDGDMLTVRGERKEETVNNRNYLYKECYWGSFSRSIILPCEVNNKKIEAVLESGILTITLIKIKTKKKVGIKVREK